MRTLKDLKLLPVWVNSGHLISTALLIMRGHGLKALGVVDEGALVGVLSAEDIVGHSESETVASAMSGVQSSLELTEPVRMVAEKFVQGNFDYAPVLDGAHYVGMVTSTMLLRELGRSWDPQTNLSWSDGLREWGVEHLKLGQEITILFIDLDDFGSYNKKYGHVVGDKVLKLTGDMLKDSIDEERDILVRYGGDEFAIGTLRLHDDAVSLSKTIEGRMGELFVDGVHQPVTFSIGLCGGKRTKERENTHYMATLDSLINMASRESQTAKKAKAEALAPKTAVVQPRSAVSSPATPVSEPAAESAAGIPTIVMVSADETSMTGTTSVWLNLEGTVASGVHLREGRALIESVAIATADALRKVYPGLVMTVDNIYLTERPGGIRIAGVTGAVSRGRQQVAVSATKDLGSDLYMDIASATVDAFLTRPELPDVPDEPDSDGDELESDFLQE